MAPSSFLSKTSAAVGSAAILVLAIQPLSGCGASALGQVAVSLGQSFLGTATQNYSEEYGQDMEVLLQALTTDVMGVGLPTEVLNAIAGRPPISLDVAILRETVVDEQSIPTPIPNGTTLHDGGGDPNAGDNLKFSFEAGAPCYIYVISVDGSGWAQPIFPSPSSPGTNPVAAHRQFTIPEGNEWFFLDQYRGVETVYFMASYVPRKDIEDMMADLAGRTRPALSRGVARVGEAAVVERGIGGTRAGKAASVAASDGSIHAFNPTSFFSEQGRGDMVITRWFRHE
ncbi:MAG TPA: DUF4384 domain-containing protein [Planctomycetota bacterium]